MYIKHFLEWIGLKERLHSKNSKPPYVNEGDVWWVSFGHNVGSEIDGKSDRFSRPAIILKKFTSGFYFVVPTTTQAREGSWYVRFRQQGKDIWACLHQARPIDYRRFYSKLGRLDDSDFLNVKQAFRSLHQ